MGNDMQRATAALLLLPRCGAHARTTGEPCKGWAMKNGRCRMHGGKAGRKPTHGRYTKHSLEQQREVRELMRVFRLLMKVANK